MVNAVMPRFGDLIEQSGRKLGGGEEAIGSRLRSPAAAGEGGRRW